MPRIFKVKEKKSKVSNEHQSDCANFLIINCAQKLPENEQAIISATMEYTSEEDRDMETNSNAAVRGSIQFISCLISDPHRNPDIV